MISPAVLEQPGRWRTVGIALGLALALTPAVSLLWPAFLAGSPESSDALGSSFGNALARSLLVAAGAAGLSFLVGLPTGVFAGLYEFPARRWLLGALALPLLVPSFLWAIGLSMLRIRLGLTPSSVFSGATGCILAFSSLGLPLVVYASFAATRTLSKGQVDAVRLAGGERTLVQYASRSAGGVAALAAMLAGVVALSDPGPGQILGYPGVATQVLTSFSALYDFGLAARQALALALAGIVLLITLPLAWLAAPRLASGLLARDVAHAPLRRTRVSATVPARQAGRLLKSWPPTAGRAASCDYDPVRANPLGTVHESVRIPGVPLLIPRTASHQSQLGRDRGYRRRRQSDR